MSQVLFRTLHFKISVGGVFVAVHLHISHVALLRGGGRVDLHVAVCDVHAAGGLATEHDDGHDEDDEDGDGTDGNTKGGSQLGGVGRGGS